MGSNVVKKLRSKFRLRFNLISMLTAIGLVAVLSDIWTSSREHIIDANLKSHNSKPDLAGPDWLIESWPPPFSSPKPASDRNGQNA